MSEHLRYLSRTRASRCPACRTPGLPQLTADGAYYPLTPPSSPARTSLFATEFGLSLVGGCCGTTPEHIAAVVEPVRGRPPARRDPRPEPGVASLYQHVPFRQDTAFLAIGERTNANGSKAFREAMLAGDYDDCVEIARAQTRDGAHLLDVCVDYVGRDGAADMHEIAGRLATASTLPLVLDSTEPEVLKAGPRAARRPGGGQLGQLRGRRRPGLALRPDHAAGARARRRRRGADHRRGGPGAHRGAEGRDRRAADRRPHRELGHARVATSSSTA